MGYLEDRMKRKNGLLPPLPTRKEKKPLKKISDKKAAELKINSGDDAMDLFFDAMLKRCKGKCFFCNQPTMYKSEEVWQRRSVVAHLLEKSKFKSVSTHEDNWVELCLSCHRTLDDGMITWYELKDSHEWLILSEKLSNILPMVAMPERKNKLYTKLCELVYDIKKEV